MKANRKIDSLIEKIKQKVDDNLIPQLKAIKNNIRMLICEYNRLELSNELEIEAYYNSVIINHKDIFVIKLLFNNFKSCVENIKIIKEHIALSLLELENYNHSLFSLKELQSIINSSKLDDIINKELFINICISDVYQQKVNSYISRLLITIDYFEMNYLLIPKQSSETNNHIKIIDNLLLFNN